MWWGSGTEPGGEGSSKEPAPNPQLSELQEQFEQQQTFIAQLKEMLRKSEQSSLVSREKVDEYASTLSGIKERTKQSKLRKSLTKRSEADDSGAKSESESSARKSAVVTPAKEKINLLRQQLEENREKIAQRDKNQKGIEEMVNLLKAQLDDSQVMFNQSQSNVVKEETVPETVPSYTLESSREDLLSVLKSKDAYIEELSAKLQQFQANVLDLQENVKEKDCVIEARTKAITLLSENLSKKGKNTLDMLDETKEQMRAMQQNFVALESSMKDENQKLQAALELRETKVQHFEELNSGLESKCSDLQQIKQRLEKEVMQLNVELNHLRTESSESEMRMKEVCETNESLKLKLSELEEADSRSSSERSEQKRASSPQKSGKRAKGNRKPKTEATQSTRVAELEKLVEELRSKQEELNVQAASGRDSAESEEIVKLNKQMEEMNKTMIKMKAQHKAKLKDMQKKADAGEVAEKVSNLESENLKLGQRVAELEEEKGNLQLRLVDYESNRDKEYIADLENRIEEQKMQIENHIRTMTALESQITTASNETSSLRTELANLMHIENAQVCSEMTSVQLEEQLDKEMSQKKEIQNKFNGIVKENEELLEKIEALNREKQELAAKLENYMQENMDLIDRLEKLSAEKVSSAESIEIVESLTHQEQLEIEAYQKQLDFVSDKPGGESSELEHSPELNDSVTKLTEETTELMERIELFTVERREVMEKMDGLTAENQQLIAKIEKYESEKLNLEERYDNLCNERDILNTKVENLLKENEELLQKVEAFSREIGTRSLAPDGDSESLKEQVTEYQTLLESQKQQIIALQGELLKKAEKESISEDNLLTINEEKRNMNDQLSALQSEYDALMGENRELQRNLKGTSELVHEKDDLERVLREATARVADLEADLSRNISFIHDLHTIIEDNKNELVKSADSIAQLQEELATKRTECEAHKKDSDELRLTVAELQSKIDEKVRLNDDNNDTIDLLSSQLAELKDCMAENFEQLHQYESEMNKSTTVTNSLTEKLGELNYKIVETEHIIELKNVEINGLKAEHATGANRIAELQAELQQKHEYFAETCRQLKEKCKFLENQIHSNSGTLDDIRGPLEAKIVELETKNRDQVDKMKKIAANLKRKAAACQELETKLKELKEKWEDENKEKDEKQRVIDEQRELLVENERNTGSLLSRVQATEMELASLRGDMANTNELNHQLQLNTDELNRQNTNLTVKLQNYEQMADERTKLQNEQLQYAASHDSLQATLAEKERFIAGLTGQIDSFKLETERAHQEIVQNLRDQIESLRENHDTTQNAMDAKLQEKDMFIESLEAEHTKYKERVFKLEEGLSYIEERRQSLEDKALDLTVQLEAKSTACEEACQSEDLLERRLAALLAHDEVIEERLKQTTADNQELSDKIKTYMAENDALQTKLNETLSKLKEIDENHEKCEMLENENVRLAGCCSGLENEMKKLQSEYEQSVTAKNVEIESMEMELTAQLQELNAERKNILNRCEVLEDSVKEYTSNEQLLTDENDQLKQTLLSMQMDLDKRLAENQSLGETVAKSLLNIEKLESELSAVNLPVSVGSADSLKKEIVELQEIVARKEIDIQNYQRQNMQLQMMASFGSAPSESVFQSPIAAFNVPPVSNPSEIQSLTDSLAASNLRCTGLEDQARDLSEQLGVVRSQVQLSHDRVNELSQQNDLLQDDLAREKVVASDLQNELSDRQTALVKQTAEVGVNDIISLAEDTVTRNAESTHLLAEKTALIADLEHRLHMLSEERDSALLEVDHLRKEPHIVQEETMQRRENLEVSAAPATYAKMTEEESKQELLNKIKTLEFMLFNIEKEKDDTLVQCHEFTNELMRLVYEREKLIKDKSSEGTAQTTGVDLAALESLIVRNDDVDNSPAIRRELCSLEYAPVHVQVNKDVCHSIELQPVVEDIVLPTATYLCFNDPGQEQAAAQSAASGWGTEDGKLRESVESQILQIDAIKITADEKRMFQNMEFERSQMPAPQHEPVAQPRSAYLCYPDECKDILGADTFASEEDGWGWSAEEAKLEAEHRHTLSLRQQSPAHAKIEKLEERINDLELERNRLLDEMRTSQVRSGKLIKKLKDMKLKNDSLAAELNKRSSSDFCGLDMAIQDELNAQIQSMEKRIAELNEEHVRERSERDTHLKRIDVLTAANERMVELKEKQDGELQFWQFKNRELSSKLEQLEWGDDSGSKTPASQATPSKASESEADGTDYKAQCNALNRRVQELNSTVNDLTLDNEEMQCMLEEQRNLRLEAEKALSAVPVHEHVQSEQEFRALETKNRELSAEVARLSEEQVSLQAQIASHVSTSAELQTQSEKLQLNVDQLIQENGELTRQGCLNVDRIQSEKLELQNHLQQITERWETELKHQTETSRSELMQLQARIAALQNETRQLEGAVAEKEVAIGALNLRIQQLESEKSVCELKIQEIRALQSADKSNDEKLLQTNEKLMSAFAELESKTRELTDLGNTLSTERVQSRQTLADTVEQLAKEWAQRLDERGNDVAESWKLHLEACETEFVQKQQVLESQLTDMSAKNDELEKQLDAAVHGQNTASNSVIESLQHTLNERESEILQLTSQLQASVSDGNSKNERLQSMQGSLDTLKLKDVELSKMKTQMTEMEEEYENVLHGKNADLETARLQMLEQERRMAKEEHERVNMQTQVDEKVVQCQELEVQMNELSVARDEANGQLADMNQFIETQVLKIEELKQQLYEKSNDYDALVAEFDSLHYADQEPGTPVQEKHVHFQDEPAVGQQTVHEAPEVGDDNDDLAEPVRRAELDLALYMLHQRDVRCEELTVELMQLLEERDTLQLRLSNALRLNEELRAKSSSPQKASDRAATDVDSRTKAGQSTGAIPKSKSTAIVLGATGTELATEATEQTATDPRSEPDDKEHLASKLSQLRSIGYRDKTLQDDQETRHIQQMSLMQQHRDLAAKLPAEAAARLVDASYTLSRDVQSPSKVLLNWLWGRSTPKVNDV